MTLPLAVELLRKTTPEGALAENQPLNLSHKSKLSEELSERQGKQFLAMPYLLITNSGLESLVEHVIKI